MSGPGSESTGFRFSDATLFDAIVCLDIVLLLFLRYGLAQDVTTVGLVAVFLAAISLLAVLALRAGRAKVSATELRTENLLSSMTGGVAFFDTQGIVTSANTSFLNIIGLEEDQVLRRSFSDLFAGTEIGQLIDQALKDGKLCRDLEVSYSDSEGRSIPLQVTTSSLKGGRGERSGAIAIIKDITKIKRAEREMWQVEKMSALGRLAATVAHGVRNPLTSIDIELQLLEEDLAEWANPVREKVSARLGLIHGEIKRLDNTVQNFMRFARPPQLELSDVSPNDIVSHVLTLMGAEAQEKGIRIETRLSEDMVSIPCDESLLSQALLNIIINAFQAMRQGGELEVETLLSPDRESITITIGDSGPGIPPETLDDIFELYYTSKADGTGFGLAITQRTIHEHGGTIEAKNDPRGGARFLITLPVRREKDELREGP